MAFSTVPLELFAVRRIVSMLQSPQTAAPSYRKMLIGMKIHEGGQGMAKELFNGAGARTTYCLLGNFATLQGIHWFGSDLKGLFATAVIKNGILPFSLWSNAAQTNLSLAKTIDSIAKGCINPVVHASFFARNLLSNVSLYPGFLVRDYCYQQTDKATLSTLLGFGTSLGISSVLNSFLKPFFTAGNFSNSTRLKVARTFPAFAMIALRESVSAGFQFAHTSPQKRND